MRTPKAKDQDTLKFLGIDPEPPWTLEQIWGKNVEHPHHYQGWLPLVAPHYPTIVETGVAGGHSSRALLSNFDPVKHPHHRIVVSIDISIPGTVHEAVMQDLPEHTAAPYIRGWMPLEGYTCDVLPTVLGKLQVNKIDLFLHDSDHGYENQAFEYAWAWENVRPGGLIMSDDYVWAEGKAWDEFTTQHNLDFYTLGHAAVVVR